MHLALDNENTTIFLIVLINQVMNMFATVLFLVKQKNERLKKLFSFLQKVFLTSILSVMILIVIQIYIDLPSWRDHHYLGNFVDESIDQKFVEMH